MRKTFFMAVAVYVWATGFLGASLCPAGEPASRATTRPKPKFTISAATTHILGPVNADGTINYAAAFEARLGQGVTPANNAAILLLRALGPEYLPKEARAGVLKRLDMASLPAEGNYFVPFADWIAEPGADEDVAEARRELAEAQRNRALTGPWSAKDLPRVAAWLKANEIPLAVAVAATKRPRYHLPGMYSTPRMFHRLSPRLATVRDLGRALVARAMLKLQRGQTRGACADLLAAHHLARLIGQDSTVIGCLVAYSMDRVANAAETALAASGRLTAAQARAHLADLQALSPLPSMRQVIDMAERWVLLDCVMVCIRNEDLQKLLGGVVRVPAELRSLQSRQPDWDQVLRTVNHWYTRLAEVAGETNAARRHAAAEVYTKDFMAYWNPPQRGLWGTLWTGQRTQAGGYTERVARRLLRMLMPSMGWGAEYREQAAQHGLLAQVALALAVHKAERGAYPASLAALAPGILKAVPPDRFSGGPLRYRREGGGYILYSLGVDLDDDGGREVSDGDDDGDIVVRVE